MSAFDIAQIVLRVIRRIVVDDDDLIGGMGRIGENTLDAQPRQVAVVVGHDDDTDERKCLAYKSVDPGVAIGPLIALGERPPPLRTGAIAVGKGGRDGAGEFVGAGGAADEVSVHLDFLEWNRDNWLSCAQILVELHRIYGVRHLVELERNETDIEMPEQRRHVPVRAQAEELYVRHPIETAQIGNKNIAGEDELPCAIARRELRKQIEIEPFRDRSVITDHWRRK